MLFLFYLKILSFQVEFEFNKPIVIKSILPVPKPRPMFSFSPRKPVLLSSRSVSDLLNNNIKNNTVLIFEPAFYHQECTPGFAKYFLDLGYNVDAILDVFGLIPFPFLIYLKMWDYLLFMDYLNLVTIQKNINQFLRIIVI